MCTHIFLFGLIQIQYIFVMFCVFNSVFDNTVLLVLNLDYKSKNMTGTHLKILKKSRRIQGCKGQPMRIWQVHILLSQWWLWLSAPSSCPHVFPSIHPLYYTYPQWLNHIKTFLFFIICAVRTDLICWIMQTLILLPLSLHVLLTFSVLFHYKTLDAFIFKKIKTKKY